ncbi:MAG: hypothetical protein MI861_08515 [Pirellulales bacterium]|nr:hypothetical protein [Pirellulales bacterium]
MQLLKRIRQWWIQRFDPKEKQRRIERKKASQMAKFLERNEKKSLENTQNELE